MKTTSFFLLLVTVLSIGAGCKSRSFNSSEQSSSDNEMATQYQVKSDFLDKFDEAGEDSAD